MGSSVVRMRRAWLYNLDSRAGHSLRKKCNNPMYSLKVICNIGALASSYRKNISPLGASWINTVSAYVSSLGRPNEAGWPDREC